jgi:hypothetical protein
MIVPFSHISRAIDSSKPKTLFPFESVYRIGGGAQAEQIGLYRRVFSSGLLKKAIQQGRTEWGD